MYRKEKPIDSTYFAMEDATILNFKYHYFLPKGQVGKISVECRVSTDVAM